MLENSVIEVLPQEIDLLLSEAEESWDLLFDGLSQEQVQQADFNENATVSTASSVEQLTKVADKAQLTPVLDEAAKSNFRFPYNVIVGTNQADDLAGTNQADIILGLDEDDFLVGLGGNDIIVGGNGNDEQFGNRGNDVIIGGAGNDLLSGGRVSDTGEIDTANYGFLSQAITLEAVGVVNKGSLGSDRIVSIEKIVGAFGKNNAIDGSTGTSGVTSFDINLQNNQLTVNNIPGLGNVNFIVENFVDVTGTSQADNVVGNDRDNRLIGGDGNDNLLGGGGADILVGGAGSDNLTGGTGADLFEFTFFDLFADRITDFNRAEGDRLSISFFGSGFDSVSYDRFDFDAGSGNLTFDGQEIADINAQSGFNLEQDLNITGATIAPSSQPVVLEPANPTFEPFAPEGGFVV